SSVSHRARPCTLPPHVYSKRAGATDDAADHPAWRGNGQRMTARLRWRKLVSGFMLTMTGVCALIAVSVLFLILGHLVYNGGASSIVIGIFAFAVAVHPFGHFSTLAGSFALGLMMIPITFRNTEEFLRAVPKALREGSMALGAGKWTTIVRVIIPAAYRGILTAILLALARVAGETAPLLFTALGNRYWSPGWNQPTASLPVMIFTYAISPYDDWHRQAWAAGLVLLALILIVNIFARAI